MIDIKIVHNINTPFWYMHLFKYKAFEMNFQSSSNRKIMALIFSCQIRPDQHATKARMSKEIERYSWDFLYFME